VCPERSGAHRIVLRMSLLNELRKEFQSLLPRRLTLLPTEVGPAPSGCASAWVVLAGGRLFLVWGEDSDLTG
jgi:hypothetical protein